MLKIFRYFVLYLIISFVYNLIIQFQLLIVEQNLYILVHIIFCILNPFCNHILKNVFCYVGGLYIMT